MQSESKLQRLRRLEGQLTRARTPFEAHWQSLADYILPERYQRTQQAQQQRDGEEQHGEILDSTATQAAETLASGMMAGISSPARPWFALTLQDAALAEQWNVRAWLHACTQRMSDLFRGSNLYRELPTCYGDLGVFGSHAIGFLEDEESVFRFESYPLGSWWAAVDEKGRVDTFLRKLRMTARQIFQKFGQPDAKEEGARWGNISQTVRAAVQSGNLEDEFEVVHVVTRNADYRPSSALAKHKRFSSCYYENGTGTDDKLLRESGFDEFPILVPRWTTVSTQSVYGRSRGMLALGDVRGLQAMEERSLMAAEHAVNPALLVPDDLAGEDINLLPGGRTIVSSKENSRKVEVAHAVNFDLQKAELKQQQTRDRINRAFFADLFLMLAMSDRRQITAREIEERHEEKMLMLGPVLERVHAELHGPLVERGFQIMARRGEIPPPPPEIEGMPLKIEFVSILAQVQKQLGLAAIDRLITFAGGLVQQTGDAAVIDAINTDETFREYGKGLGVPPTLLRSPEEVEQLRAERGRQAQTQAQADELATKAKAAKDLAAADLSGDNALTALVRGAAGGAVA